MKTKSPDEVLAAFKDAGLIPVFNHADIEISCQVLDACYKGGVRVFEFTNRGSNALEVFAALKEHGKNYPDLVLGIGTIFSVEQAQAFQAIGAEFIVSPAMVPDLGIYCQSQDLLWAPGCATVTEIYSALELGARIVKAFPGNVLGPGFVKSVKAVFPSVPIMPTGGVSPTEENLKAWFDAGVTCVGMGSKLIGKDILHTQNFDALEKTVRNGLRIISKLKA